MKARKFLMIAVLALSFTAVIAWLTPALAAGGRDYPRCIKACNLVGRICDDHCETVCSSMFPGDLDLISACVLDCKAACRDQDKECRLVCKPVEEPPGGPVAP